jgi:hypothetical protein
MVVFHPRPRPCYKRSSFQYILDKNVFKALCQWAQYQYSYGKYIRNSILLDPFSQTTESTTVASRDLDLNPTTKFIYVLSNTY